jgi:hypothetical protein
MSREKPVLSGVDDETLCHEVVKRIAEDRVGGIAGLGSLRSVLDALLWDLRLRVIELEFDDPRPRRVWVIDGWTGPRIYLGCDEYGNRPLCLRIGGDLLCLNWAPRLKRELWEPEDSES